MRLSYLYGDQGAGYRTQNLNGGQAGFTSGQNSNMMDDLKVCLTKNEPYYVLNDLPL
jgi:hypothetical protein